LEVVPADRGRPLRRQLRWRKRDEGHTDDNESHRAAQEMGAFRQAALVWSTPADVGHPSQMAGFASVGLFCLLYIVRVSGEPMTELRWMPVFSVIEATRTVHAAHPTQATTKAPHLDEQAEDFR
jgi:hypothetical protein